MLSKRGLCSRTVAAQWIREGRVSVNGSVVRDAEFPVRMDIDAVTVDAAAAVASSYHYLALNKPRGLVTTARDERGRDTVYRCFDGADLQWLAPVGRLDKASEGLLLFSNDPAWSAAITSPESGLAKTYHVQVDAQPDAELLRTLTEGVAVEGDSVRAVSATLLRTGTRTAWLEIVLDEGRNRQIRRMLDAHGLAVLRLVRVAIGSIALSTLAKGSWRELDASEVVALAAPTRIAGR